MALNVNTAPDAHWTGPYRLNPKTDDAGVPVSAGLRLPNLTTSERDALTEVETGLLIYNSTTNKANLRVAAAWEAITSA